MFFFGPEGGSQNANLVVFVLVVVISSKSLEGFLNMQQTATKLCIQILAEFLRDLPSQIFHLFSN